MKTKLLLNMVVIVVLLVCCRSPISGFVHNSTSGSISIVFHSNARTVVPNWNTVVSSYAVTLSSHDGYASQALIVTGNAGSANFSSVNPGTWDIAASALNGAIVVGVGSLSGQVVASGSSLSLTVPIMSSQTGTGNFTFSFAFPSSTSINYVSAQLFNSTSGSPVGSTLVPSLASSGAYIQGTIAQTGIASGSYYLQLTFFRNGSSGTVAGVYGEGINVWDNVTSDQWLDSSGNLNSQRVFAVSEFNLSNTDLANLVVFAGGSPLTLSPLFASNVTSYTTTSNTSVTIKPTASMAGQLIQYQLNGTSGVWITIQSGATSPSISVPSGGTVIEIKVTATDQTTATVYQATILSPLTLTLVAGPGGTVTPSGTTLVNSGVPTNILATPNTGYGFANWTVTAGIASIGSTSTADTTVTLTSGNATLQAMFLLGLGTPLSLAGSVATFPSGFAGFNGPAGITTDGTSLYVAGAADNEISRIVIATGVVSTFAGSTTAGSADGIGSTAGFSNPCGIATDGTNLYVADTNNNEIRKVVIATGEVTTLAGTTTRGSADGTGNAASFSNPCGIATDGINLYVSDTVNNEIRKIVIATGAVTTLAGSTPGGSADGTGTSASFNNPYGITTDGISLYIADGMNNEIRKILISTGAVSTLAGSTSAGSTNGTGVSARFGFPYGITTDGTNLYVSDSNTSAPLDNQIRAIVIATGVVTTLAGSTNYGNANGTGNLARFNSPGGMTTDGISLYVADTGNNEVRRIQ